MLDHVHLRVADLAASRRFYAAAAAAVAARITAEGEDWFEVGGLLFVSTDGPPTTGMHLAFAAADEAAVRHWHAAVLDAGGRDNGAPGLREYGPGYFAAYALDPDGTNVEAVYHAAG